MPKMKMKLGGSSEMKVLKHELNENTEKMKIRMEYGSKVEKDLIMLKNQIDSIYASDLEAADKNALIKEVKAAMDALVREHDLVEKDVQEKLDENEEIVEEINDKAKQLEEKKTELSGIKLESGAADLSKAIDATEKRKQELNEYAKQEVNKIAAAAQVLQAQKNMILKNKYKK